jgi:hypothetical protein
VTNQLGRVKISDVSPPPRFVHPAVTGLVKRLFIPDLPNPMVTNTSNLLQSNQSSLKLQNGLAILIKELIGSRFRTVHGMIAFTIYNDSKLWIV